MSVQVRASILQGHNQFLSKSMCELKIVKVDLSEIAALHDIAENLHALGYVKTVVE